MRINYDRFRNISFIPRNTRNDTPPNDDNHDDRDVKKWLRIFFNVSYRYIYIYDNDDDDDDVNHQYHINTSIRLDAISLQVEVVSPSSEEH